MAEPLQCPDCYSVNEPDAIRCRVCGHDLKGGGNRPKVGAPVQLHRVMSGEVFAARVEGIRRRPQPPLVASPSSPNAAVTLVPTESAELPVEDNSDAIAAAMDRIRAKAHTEGHRFRPYVPAKGRRTPTAEAKQDATTHLDSAILLFRERQFEDAIEPLLKAIARDDEDRRSWILLAEAYLRSERPYKAAVGYLRALELSSKDEQAWLGVARVLKAICEVPTAAAVLDRAVRINPGHADTWLERGVILESLQSLPEAAKSFLKVLELRPDHRVAQTKRKELETKILETPIAPPEIKAVAPVEPQPSEPSIEDGFSADIIDELLGRDDESEEPKSETQHLVVTPKTSRSTPEPRPARIRTFVDGLDDRLDGGVPWGHVVLIEGAPGTMKSSLAFSILLQNAAREGLHCIYLSLEERTSSLLKQIGSLGLKLAVPKGSLVVLDPKTTSELFAEKTDWIEALEHGIASIKAQRGLDLMVIDSLEALEVLAKFKDRRRELYRLFEWLRDQDVTCFVVTERPDWLIAGHVLQGRWDEDFLADGVVQLRIHMVSDLEAQRRLRVVKMRGTRHETGYLAMDLDDGHFRVTRAMSP